MLPPERWALTPPFHPYRALSPSTAHSRGPSSRPTEGFPSAGHRGALHRRFIFCGTVRSQNHAARFREPAVASAPWRYQARCPTVSGLSSRPAFLRRPAQRSPGLPANFYYSASRREQPRMVGGGYRPNLGNNIVYESDKPSHNAHAGGVSCPLASGAYGTL